MSGAGETATNPADAGYILVKGDQGLGNRILCLLSATLLARLTGRRLVVDWRDPLYSADGSDAFSRLLRHDLAVPLEALPEASSIRPPTWRGRLHEPASVLRRERFGARGSAGDWSWEPFCTDLDRIDHRERVLVFTSFFETIAPLRRHMTGDLAGLRALSTATVLRRLWSDHLSLAPALEDRVNEFRRTRFAAETLGVHVRATDRRTRIRAVEARATRIARRHPHIRVFLSTDNGEELRRWGARFGDVISTEKWYPPPGAAMHTHGDRPDPTAGAADALVDLHLLAACDRLIVDSRSSFGRLAALRSRAAPANVIDVHPGRFAPIGLRHALRRLAHRATRPFRSRTS